MLVGNGSDGALNCEAGNETLEGGDGAGDTLPAFKNLACSAQAIADFATGDHIDRSAIDANGNSGKGDTNLSFGSATWVMRWWRRNQDRPLSILNPPPE
jgi:hypothetical protein